MQDQESHFSSHRHEWSELQESPAILALRDCTDSLLPAFKVDLNTTCDDVDVWDNSKTVIRKINK